MSKLSRKPKNTTVIRPETTKVAWWYENEKSVDVFLEGQDGRVLACRLYWRDLRAALARAEAP